MKLALSSAAMLLSLNLFACALDPDPQTDSAAQAVEQPPDLGVIAWDPARNSAEDIWPAGQGITLAEVTLQPDPACHDGSTMLAVVRWNGAVAATFQVRAGSDEAAFRQVVTSTHATLSVATGDHGGATTNTGSASAGPVNPPHPNI